MVAIEVAAAKATLLPKLGRPRMKLRMQASHTFGMIRTRKALDEVEKQYQYEWATSASY